MIQVRAYVVEAPGTVYSGARCFGVMAAPEIMEIDPPLPLFRRRRTTGLEEAYRNAGFNFFGFEQKGVFH